MKSTTPSNMKTSRQHQYKYLQFKENSGYRRFIKAGELNIQQTEDKENEPAINTPAHGTYGGLLFHPEWKAKRKEILTRDKHQCVICKSDEELQVHHRQYHFIASKNQFSLPWEYPDYLLITLCESCHSRGHNKYKVPTITL